MPKHGAVKVGLVLRVAAIVAEAFEVSPDDLISKCKKLQLVKARHTLYKILYILVEHKSNIGRSLDRDHTTIIHGLKEFNNLYQYDEDFKRRADIAMKQLIKTKYEEEPDTP